MDSMEARLATNAPSDSKMRAEYGIGARDGVLDAEAVAVDVANVSSMPTLMAMDLDPDRERADAVHARAIENGAGSAAVSELAACSVLLGLASAPAPPQHHASDATMSSYQPPSNRSSPSNSSAHHQQQLSHSQIHPDLQLAQPVNYLQTQYAVLPDSPSQVQNQRLAKHHRLPSISTLLEQLPPLSAASPVDKPSSNMPITPIPGPAINRETVEIPSPTSVPPPITLGPAPIAQPSYSRLGSHPHHGHGQGHRPHSMHKKSYSMGSFDFIHSIQNQSQREHGASVFNSTSGGLMGGSGARIRLPQPQLNQPQQPLQIAPKLPSYTVHYPPLHASQFVSHPAVPQQQHLQPHGQQQDASANLANSNTGDVNSSQAYHAFHKKTSSMDSNGSTSSSDFGHHPHATPASGHLATQRFEAQPLPPQSQPFARHPPTSQGGNPPPMVIDIRSWSTQAYPSLSPSLSTYHSLHRLRESISSTKRSAALSSPFPKPTSRTVFRGHTLRSG
ncbi:hypothetical protein BC830DRAFT_442919 [Chytriomyces sp. MP71]|nr:hypothetical protein BC830DRAFT_442919 [Chytriomyces sp. MP71]